MIDIKVLLVEDETTLAMIVKETLEGEGFEVTTANDGIEGLELAQKIHPHIVVADIMMPNMDGFEMVRRMRNIDETTPILFLTARSAVDDVVEGFNLGANDYLRKPFSMLELIVRIKSLIKQSGRATFKTVAEDTNICVGNYTLNTTRQILSIGEWHQELTSRETELLVMLGKSPNEVIPTRNILMKLWGDDTPYNYKSLLVFITKLRRLLERDPRIKIINARGIGYKLVI